MIIAIFAISAFILSAWLTHRFSSPDSIFYILDQPNERSLHNRSLPRGGGVAILTAIIVSGTAQAIFSFDWNLMVIASSILVVATVALLDDCYSVSPVYRLMAQTVAAMIILYGGLFLETFEIPGTTWQWPYAVGAMFSALYLLWMINLYNFMDGMDGIAAGMAVFGFGTFAIMGGMADHKLFLTATLIIASASAGFLVFNFPPARIFMGDVGSSTLGLLAATFSLWGAREEIFPLWAAVLIFSPFIADATVTLIRRVLKGEKFWKPHKTHYYQKLVESGWGHRKTLVVEYGIMLACGISALVSIDASSAVQVVVLTVWILFYIIFFSWISRISSKQRS